PANNNGGSGGVGTPAPIASEISAAEVRRGFPLPYVMASAGMYADEEGYVLGFDLIEVTEETEVEVAFEKFNDANQPVDADGETLGDFEARVQREIDRQTSMMEAFEKFPQWFQTVRGETLEEGFEENRKWRIANGIPVVTYAQYVELWWDEDYVPNSIAYD